MNLVTAENALLETLWPEALLRALRQDEPAPSAIADGCAALGDALTALPHINREVAALLRAWTNAHPQQHSLLE